MDGLLCIQISRPDGEPIDVERWKELIENDPELSPIEFTDGVNPMTRERVRIPYEEPAAVWSAHPEGYSNYPLVFACKDGLITALCADRPFVGKGEEVAQKLNAAIGESVD